MELTLKDVISGVATTTLGFPPNYESFASASPNVRETDSLPGRTLKGPITISLFSFAVAPAGAAVRLYCFYVIKSFLLINLTACFNDSSLL